MLGDARNTSGAARCGLVKIRGATAVDVNIGSLKEDERRRIVSSTDQLASKTLATSFALRRGVLALEADCAPEAIRIAYESAYCGSQEHGRPRLHLDAPHDIRFSTSHVNGIALVAVIRGAPIGVDIEGVIPMSHRTEIASSVLAVDDDACFTPTEYWTAKEAVVKMTGYGLAVDLTSVNAAPLGSDLGLCGP